MSKKKEPTLHFGKPGAWAVARNQAGGDWAAACLLYRAKFYFQEGKKRLERHGREWIAMSRSDWARECGLSESEMKNRALPKLRKRQFMTIRAMKITPQGPKLLWISIDFDKMAEWTEPSDFFENQLNGMHQVGVHPDKLNYPYKIKTEV